MRYTMLFRGLPFIAAAILIACAAPAAEPTDEPVTVEPTAEPITAPSTAPNASRTPPPTPVRVVPLTPSLEALVTPSNREETAMPAQPRSPQTEFAIRDLADRLNISTDQIEVVVQEEVTWPDGSLGCPQPGMMYTQALVDGVRIVLRAQGRDYAYHAGGNRDPFLCDSTSPFDITPRGGDERIPPPGLPDS